MGQIKQMMDTVKMSQNPQMVLNQIAMKNPTMKQVMDLINQHGSVENALNAVRTQYGLTEQDVRELMK
jgi:hypothetical protein